MKISSFFLSFLTVASSCSVVVGQLHSQSEPYICPTDWCMSVMSQMGRRLETTPEMAQASGGHGRRLLGISTLDFEGIGNLEPIGNSYAAAGIEFSSNALALIDNDVGGSGVCKYRYCSLSVTLPCPSSNQSNPFCFLVSSLLLSRKRTISQHHSLLSVRGRGDHHGAQWFPKWIQLFLFQCFRSNRNDLLRRKSPRNCARHSFVERSAQ